MRANTFVPPSLPIYYFEVEVVSKGREGYLQLPRVFGLVSLWFRVLAFTLCVVWLVGPAGLAGCLSGSELRS